jgi:hypothetical protein
VVSGRWKIREKQNSYTKESVSQSVSGVCLDVQYLGRSVCMSVCPYVYLAIWLMYLAVWQWAVGQSGSLAVCNTKCLLYATVHQS